MTIQSDWSRSVKHALSGSLMGCPVERSHSLLRGQAFSRALGNLLSFTLSSHWFLRLYSFHLIGRCDKFNLALFIRQPIEKRPNKLMIIIPRLELQGVIVLVFLNSVQQNYQSKRHQTVFQKTVLKQNKCRKSLSLLNYKLQLSPFSPSFVIFFVVARGARDFQNWVLLCNLLFARACFFFLQVFCVFIMELRFFYNDNGTFKVLSSVFKRVKRI